MLVAAIIIGTLYDIFAVQMKTKVDTKETEQVSGDISRQNSSKISLYKPKNTFYGIPNAYLNGAYMSHKADDEQEVKLGNETKTADKENEINKDKRDVAIPPKEDKCMKAEEKSIFGCFYLCF
jgi:hypothetical protein